MRCDNCGAVNPEGLKFCGNCGKPLLMGGSMAVTPEGKARNCVSCGRAIGWDANICMYCGYDYRVKKTKPGAEGHLITGAILTLLGSILGIAILLILYTSPGIDANMGIFVLTLCCSVLGVIGGFAALMQQWFPIAVLGAAAAIFSFGFFLAIPGLVMIANSATKFKGFADTK